LVIAKAKNNLLKFSIGAVLKKTALFLTLFLAFSMIVVAGAHCLVVGSATFAAETTQSSSVLVSHFNVDLVYVYAAGDFYAAIAIVNFTSIPNQTLPIDGVSDLYILELYSDGQMIGGHVIGVNIGADTSMDFMMGMSMSVGAFASVGEASAEHKYGLTTWEIPYNPPNPSFVQPLTVKLIRTGWIVVEGNYTWSSMYQHKVIEEVRLVQYQDGYLYNNLVPQEQLTDPKHPPTPTIHPSPTLSSLPTSTPLPTQEPGSSLESTFTSSTAILVEGSIIAVAAACASVLVYFRKRRFQLGQVYPTDSVAQHGSQAPRQ
jgi:hypothetical protein